MSNTTRRLRLVPKTLADVHAQIAAMTADQRALMSRDWLALLASPAVDSWTLGFDIVDRDTNAVVGTCGFKGPPGIDGVVEIAYGVNPDQQGKGYATEAAEGLVAYAFGEVIDPEDGPVWRWERQYERPGASLI